MKIMNWSLDLIEASHLPESIHQLLKEFMKHFLSIAILVCGLAPMIASGMDLSEATQPNHSCHMYDEGSKISLTIQAFPTVTIVKQSSPAARFATVKYLTTVSTSPGNPQEVPTFQCVERRGDYSISMTIYQSWLKIMQQLPNGRFAPIYYNIDSINNKPTSLLEAASETVTAPFQARQIRSANLMICRPPGCGCSPNDHQWPCE
jgi:hypothetical protein